MPEHQRGKSGTRKYGRNKVKCASYRINKSVKNKLSKLRRHLKKHQQDGVAAAALKNVYSA